MNDITNTSNHKKNRGLTLIETLVAVALFAIIGVTLYGVYAQILKSTVILNVRTVAASLANEQFEIVRNMPYASVGTIGGIPAGTIPPVQNLDRDGNAFVVTTTVRNIDEEFDGMIGETPNDLSPADNKMIAVEIDCPLCTDFSPLEYTTHIAPKNLETASTNGALVINVFDANGVPIEGADVAIDNVLVIPAVHIDDVTGVDGSLTIVDAPPSVGGYHIVVTKPGYSTDQTYPSGDIENPNPTAPDVTVVIQQISQVSFTIAELGSLETTTLTDICTPVPSIDYNLTGTKLIGLLPDILKFDESFTTNASGLSTINNLEWDTYDIAVTDSAYDLIGTNPLLSLGLGPNQDQTMQMIVAPKNPKLLLVVVRDQSTELPITDAIVELVRTSDSHVYTRITGQGFMTQTDWSGGGGQQNFIDNPTKYNSSDSNIDRNSPVGELKLHPIHGVYAASGKLTSSTFDTAGASNYHQIFWTPTDQPPETGANPVRFKIATSAVNGDTWDFWGPDGTSSTYYTLSDNNLSPALNGKRYLRYRIFMDTQDTAFTPNISDISFTFTTACTPPGQVSFGGLASGDYDVTVTKSGYQTYHGTVPLSDDWQKLEVVISP